MGSASTALYFNEETTWGTQATGTYQTLHFTGESFARKMQKEISAEIRADRQVADIITVNATVDGGFNFELSYNTFNDLLEGALWDDWSDEISISSNQIGINTSGVLTAASGATNGSANFYSLEPGHWFKLEGSSEDDNNTYYQVISKDSSTQITVAPNPSATVATGIDTVTINSTVLRNGVEKHSYSFIRKHRSIVGADAIVWDSGISWGDRVTWSDTGTVPTISDQFFTFIGCVCNTFSLVVKAGSILIGSFEFLGKTATLTQSSTALDGNETVAGTKIFNTANDIYAIREDGNTVADCLINSIELQVNNNIRARSAVANLNTCGIGVGKCDVTGQIVAYFQDNDLYDKFISGESTSLSFRIQDAEGNSYIIDLPYVKFSDNKVNIGGVDQDVMQNISFVAIMHPTNQYTIQICKFSS